MKIEYMHTMHFDYILLLQCTIGLLKSTPDSSNHLPVLCSFLLNITYYGAYIHIDMRHRTVCSIINLQWEIHLKKDDTFLIGVH